MLDLQLLILSQTLSGLSMGLAPCAVVRVETLIQFGREVNLLVRI